MTSLWLSGYHLYQQKWMTLRVLCLTLTFVEPMAAGMTSQHYAGYHSIFCLGSFFFFFFLGAAPDSNPWPRSVIHWYYNDQGVPDDAVAEPFTNYDEACLNLLQIEVPDREETPNNMFAFDCYHRVVHAIRDNPNAAYAQHCIVCWGQHRFEYCPTLNDHDFLKQHHIRFCQNVRRDQSELSQQRGQSVNFMDHTCFDDEESESDSSNRDFPYGRR